MRKLTLDICDYNKTPVCNIYDNQSDILGQAANVVIKTERSGWKELSFELPSTVSTEDGEEKNHRLDYLIADWWIKAEDDYETDWYIISQPKITHKAFSENIEVVAGHISQILKTKNLGLEFSDDEGNNVGTALELLETILEGTGWTPGNVAQFMEDDDFSKEKKRSLNDPVRTGAFKLITDMCELFDAKPIFHGETKTVDIQPINPFSHVIEYDGDTIKVGQAIDLEESQIPTAALNTNVVELHYDKNVTSMTRTVNTENLVTKLTAQGSVGDTTVEPCSLSNAYHYEYTFETNGIAKGTEVCFEDKFEMKHYFTAIENIPAGNLVWSTLDLLSQSYIWDGTTAHPVYKYPKTENYITISTEADAVKNWFTYLMNLSYYDQIGLLSQDMLNSSAEFQRSMPEYLENSYNASLNLSEQQNILSETAESMTGFLKLSISGRTRGDGNCLKLYINTNDADEGVIYRSDYQEPRRKYFPWHVAHSLKANGDSVDNEGSVVYIIKDNGEGNIPYWIKGYVRSIDDKTEKHTDIDGVVTDRYADYTYTADNDPPHYITTFIDYDECTNAFDGPIDFTDPNVYVFLFCTYSMVGSLGSLFTADEAALESLDSSTKVVTEIHPTFFAEEDYLKLPNNPSELTQTYAFGYVNHRDKFGELYFYCVNVYDPIVTWSKVYIGETLPEIKRNSYFFDRKLIKLYYAQENEWVYMESTEEKRMTQNLAKALYFCLRREMLLKGMYEKYVYTFNDILYAGNYAIESPYYFGWFFTTDMTINATHVGSEDYQLADIAFVKEDDKYVSPRLSLTPKAWYEYFFKTDTEIYSYDSSDNLVADNFYKGGKSLRASDDVSYIIIKTEEQPTEGEYLTAKQNCQLWVDTSKNVVYQENSIAHVVEAQSKRYDTVTFPVANMLDGVNFYNGSIDSRGIEVSAKNSQRSYNVDMYSNVKYEYFLPITCEIFIYDVNKHFARVIKPEQGASTFTGTYTTKTNEGYFKILYKSKASFDTDTYYFRVKDYQNKVFADDKIYTILDNIQGEGQLKGINRLIRLFALQADTVYLEYLPQLLTAQEEVKNRENALALILGDMYREGWTLDDQYVKGDENKLYRDTLSNLREISKPETTYDIGFVDTYGSNEGDEFYVDEAANRLDYSDIRISDTIHLIDPEMNINLWCYIDTLNKCYDQPWKTSLEINTTLSDIGQHSFTDVMSYIAEVAKRTKANQSIYARAGNINEDGSITAEQIKGEISAVANKISGGSSNWRTDDKGNIVVESQDGQSAIMITGAGILNSNSKDADGDWNWSTVSTGEGVLADAITAGTLTGALIKAGTITADALCSNVGQALDIASNEALYLYATVDGIRPAGGLDTALPGTGDSYIIIEAGNPEREQHPEAHVEIASGGSINVYGGSEVNITSGGELNLSGAIVNIISDTELTLTGAIINITGTSEVNISSGGKIRIDSDGSFRIHSDTSFSIDSPNFKVIETVRYDELDPLEPPDEQEYEDLYEKYGPDYYEWSLEGKEAYLDRLPPSDKVASVSLTGSILNGLTALNDVSDHDGLYIGVDGIKTRTHKEVIIDGRRTTQYYDAFKLDTITGSAFFKGDIYASGGEIGGFTITGSSIYNGISGLTGGGTGIYLGTDGLRLSAYYSDQSSSGYYDALKFAVNGTFSIDFSHSTTAEINLPAFLVRTENGQTLNVTIGDIQGDITDIETELAKKPSITVGPTAPSNPENGDIWFDTTVSIQKVYNEEVGDWEFRPLSTVTGALMNIDANAGTLSLWTSSSGTQSNVIYMSQDGITISAGGILDIKGDGGINIETGGTFIIDTTAFDVKVNVPGEADEVIIGGWTATSSGLSGGNGRIKLNSESGLGWGLYMGTYSDNSYNIKIYAEGLYIGQYASGYNGFGFSVNANGEVFCTWGLYIGNNNLPEYQVYGYADLVNKLNTKYISPGDSASLNSLTINSSYSFSSGGAISCSSISIGSNFSVNSSGDINCDDIECDSFHAGSYSNTGLTVDSNDNIICKSTLFINSNASGNQVYGYNDLVAILDARYAPIST